MKTVAIRRQILLLKCTKFDFGWGSAPDPTAGAYSAPPDRLAAFNGPISNGGEGGREAERRGRRGMRTGGKGQVK